MQFAAEELEKLDSKYQEPWCSYDAMSLDFLKLIDENKRLKSEEKGRKDDV